jgi:two-component system response regulator PhoP
MLNTDRIVSKNELTEHLYAQDFDRDSNVIEVFVGRLRRKLEPLKLIRTVRGQGYLLSTTENNSVADA